MIGARGVGDLPSAPGNWPGGVLPEKLSGGVRSPSQNPYPLYDPKSAIFPTLFMTRPKI